MCLVFRESEEGGEWGRGLIYLNSLVVMKAVMTCWGWIDGVSGEKRGEGRVNEVKSNCRQIAGLDNDLNRPQKPLNSLLQCASILMCRYCT